MHFQVLGKDLMDYGIRSGQSLIFGIPMASPLSSLSIGNFTWSYIFIRHMICVLLGASCMKLVFAFYISTIILVVHAFWEEIHLIGIY